MLNSSESQRTVGHGYIVFGIGALVGAILTLLTALMVIGNVSYPDWEPVKAERDRRLKAGESEQLVFSEVTLKYELSQECYQFHVVSISFFILAGGVLGGFAALLPSAIRSRRGRGWMIAALVFGAIFFLCLCAMPLSLYITATASTFTSFVWPQLLIGAVASGICLFVCMVIGKIHTDDQERIEG
jgi:MFS family permease